MYATISANNNSLSVLPTTSYRPSTSSRNEHTNDSYTLDYSNNKRVESSLAAQIRVHTANGVALQVPEEVRTRALQEAGQQLGIHLPLQNYEQGKWQLDDWIEVQSTRK